PSCSNFLKKAAYNEDAPDAAVLTTKTLGRKPKLAGLLGGALHLLGLLGLGGVRGVALGESEASCAEDEREAEHGGHDLFHGCISLLIMPTTLGRLAELSCQPDMKPPLKCDSNDFIERNVY